jgi:hypothetical protein
MAKRTLAAWGACTVVWGCTLCTTVHVYGWWPVVYGSTLVACTVCAHALAANMVYGRYTGRAYTTGR